MMVSGSFGWFARHELRLAWRDAVMMLQGGKRGRGLWAAVGVVIYLVLMHLLAYGALMSQAGALRHPNKAMLLAVSGSVLLSWTLLLSQAMETVTRSFYARADLDLILSSPAKAPKLFAVRIAANAVTTVAMSVALIGPVIDVAAFLGGARLLLGYGMLVALGAAALAAAVCLTSLMFRVVGPKRTRLLAQIIAAIIGAGFVVGIQAAAILSSGTLSRTALFASPRTIAMAPDLGSPLWWPAKAALGDGTALAICLGLALCASAATIVSSASSFADTATRVAGSSFDTPAAHRGATPFRRRSRASVLRSKEWILLWRDPWLVSQSLMQMLYLAPPALLLWRDYDTNIDGLVVLAPVLVMAAGQLAGGLAWLAISGEDAPDLVATAPIGTRAILRAKIEAVLIAVALPLLPIIVAIALVTPRVAAVTLVGTALAAGGASLVQLIFRSQAKRSNFRRRQTSSRLATLAEAFLSIAVAGAAGLAVSGFWLVAAIAVAIAATIPAGCWAMAGERR